MSFAAFTSAVLLAQGRFAEFLTAQPRDRDAILRELFGVASLEGARQAAAGLERVALAEADLRAADAAGLPGHDAGARTRGARAARAASAALAAARGLRAPAADVLRHRGGGRRGPRPPRQRARGGRGTSPTPRRPRP